MKHLLIIWHAIYRHEIVFPNINRLYDTEEEALDYAESWMAEYPEDIVMLDTVLIDECKNCGRPIQEKPGWVLHRWVHRSAITYICFTSSLTRAEPKGVRA